MKRLLLIGLFASISCVTVFAQSEDRRLFDEAESRFRSGDYEFALNRYDTLLEEYPRSDFVADAQFGRAMSLFQLERYDEALTVFDRVSARFRTTRYIALLPYWTGLTNLQLQRFDLAVEDLGRFLRDAEGSDGVTEQTIRDALYYRGVALAVLEDRGRAVEAFADLLARLERPTDNAYTLVLTLSLYSELGRHDELIDLYERVDLEVLSIDDQNRLRVYAAQAYLATDRKDDAEEVYRALTEAEVEIAAVAYQQLFRFAQDRGDEDGLRAVVLDAEQVLADRPDVLAALYLQVGTASFDRGQTDLAEDYLNRVWRRRDVVEIDATAPLYLAEIYLAREDSDAAVAVLSDFLRGERSGKRDPALVQLSAILVELGRFEDALRYLDEHRAGYPSSENAGRVAYLDAFSRLSLGRYEEAIRTIDEALVGGYLGELRPKVLRLRARTQRELGEFEAAVQTYRDYLSVVPDDIGAQREYVGVLYTLGRYSQVIRQGQALTEVLQAGSSPYLTNAYYLGLAHLHLQQPSEALPYLTQVADADPSLVPEAIRPFALYYAGWTAYRLSNFDVTLARMSAYLELSPESDQSPRAAYLAGRSALALGRPVEAEAFIRTLLAYETEELREDGVYLLARAQAAQGNNIGAVDTFYRFANDETLLAADLADDALFEAAELLERASDPDRAIETYDLLYALFPDAPLADEAQYRKGYVLFDTERYEAALDQFRLYRSELFVGGSFEDAALYWSGEASRSRGDEAEALFFWNLLIDDHRTSPFRGDALVKSAEIQTLRGEFDSALALYAELLTRYPTLAQSIGAEDKRRELVYLLSGDVTREQAQLLARIRRDGVESADGREATLAFGREIVRGVGGDASTFEGFAVDRLEDLADLSAEYPDEAAVALSLLAEYYSRRLPGDRRIADYYLEAAEAAEDPEFVAQMLVAAAGAYAAIGRNEEAGAIAAEIVSRFPDTDWADQARSLIEEQNDEEQSDEE